MGEMCWLPKIGSDGTKILHLRLRKTDPWQPYTSFPQYSVPDYQVPKGSKGWATFQKLRKENWQLIATAEANSYAVPEAIADAKQRGLVQ